MTIHTQGGKLDEWTGYSREDVLEWIEDHMDDLAEAATKGKTAPDMQKEKASLLDQKATDYSASVVRKPLVFRLREILPVLKSVLDPAPSTWTGKVAQKYGALTEEQVTQFVAFIYKKRPAYLLNRINTAVDLLDFALGYHRPGSETASRINRLRASPNRTIINGHGVFRPEAGWAKVPAGKTIHFYCAHGKTLDQDTSQIVEGIRREDIQIPLESREGGDSVPDYLLGFPEGVTVVGNLADQVVNMSAEKWIPLSILLQGQKCQAADEIHWCACRETLGSMKGWEWKGKYLYKLDASEVQTAYNLPQQGSEKQAFTTQS